MKYTVGIELELPRDRVIALFDDPANLKRWMPGLRVMERIDGVPGEVGVKHRLVFDHGGRQFEMIETVTVRELPERMDGTYESPMGWNGISHRFTVLGADRTRWEQTTEFRFNGLMMRLMAMLMPGMFKKQSLTYMNAFKEFAESQTDEGLERTRFEPQ